MVAKGFTKIPNPASPLFIARFREHDPNGFQKQEIGREKLHISKPRERAWDFGQVDFRYPHEESASL